MDYNNLYTVETIEKYREEFSKFGCAQIYDAASKYCHRIELGIISRTPERKLAAPIFPVITDNDMLPGLQAINVTPPGWAIFIHNKSDVSEALAGDIYCTAAESQGLGGLIINGAIRDIDYLSEINIPIFSREVTFVSAKTARSPSATVPEAISFPEYVIEPGDWIFGDQDGLLLLKQKYLTAAFNSARQLHKTEDNFRHSLRDGNRLGDIIGLDDFIAGRGDLRMEV